MTLAASLHLSYPFKNLSFMGIAFYLQKNNFGMTYRRMKLRHKGFSGDRLVSLVDQLPKINLYNKVKNPLPLLSARSEFLVDLVDHRYYIGRINTFEIFILTLITI
jgi:hypothetical protein